MAIDWLKIRNEYINGGGSYRKLAEKHGVSATAIANKAKTEQWPLRKQEQLNKTSVKIAQKTAERIAEQEVNRTMRLLALSDTLLDKLEQAASEIDSRTVTNKTKTKIVEYKDSKAPGKPTKEVVEEKEDIAVIKSLIDCQGLQQLSVALKNLKDVTTATDVQTTDTGVKIIDDV